jgi:hypothetical protein
MNACENMNEQNEMENNPMDQQTQGITENRMKNEAKNKEAFQRITTGALIQTGLRAQTSLRKASIKKVLWIAQGKQLYD